jgi:hypothetical protein
MQNPVFRMAVDSLDFRTRAYGSEAQQGSYLQFIYLILHTADETTPSKLNETKLSPDRSLPSVTLSEKWVAH